MSSQVLLEEAINHFDFVGERLTCEPYGSGHINDTYLLEYKIKHMGVVPIILQRMNTHVFKQPIELMENILNVTAFLRDKIIENNGNPERETLTVILNKSGKPYYQDSENNYWRAYHFIVGATGYDEVKNDEDFYQSALAFGKFQSLLADYPAHTLHETIADFHNTKVRFETFKDAVEKDVCHRAKDVQAEIQFVLEREDVANVLTDMQTRNELPLRVTHNDTKLNNVLIDDKTHQGICVIDLDTVMPGLAINDFGDSIRFGASTGAEDEKDLSKIECSMHLFEVYTKGFIKGCDGKLTDNEIKALPIGAKVMTFECGMRFLTDYLQGDTYFKTTYPTHNLDRCRTQFKLVSDMEAKWDTMNQIVSKYNF
ncbi:MAG: aminoglycoside phosphotransferase family protein [Coprobacillus sp.]